MRSGKKRWALGEERTMRKMLIGGQFVESLTGEDFPVVNPATEEVIDTVPRARAEDVDRAVRAAAAACDTWRFTPGIEKCELLHAVAGRIRGLRSDLAMLLTLEGGQ